jgi:DNA-binding Lrp family transcriptional regulator
VLDQQKLGLNLKAYILLSASPSEEARDRASRVLSQFPQISQIHRLFGRFDFLIEVLVKDINELSEIVGKMHRLEVITSTETLIVYKNIKYDTQHPFENALK